MGFTINDSVPKLNTTFPYTMASGMYATTCCCYDVRKETAPDGTVSYHLKGSLIFYESKARYDAGDSEWFRLYKDYTITSAEAGGDIPALFYANAEADYTSVTADV